MISIISNSLPICYLLPKPHHPIKNSCQICSKFGAFYKNQSNLKIKKDGFLFGENKLRNKKRVVIVKFNQGFNFNGGGGGKDDGLNARVLGNLALAIGLTYLSLSGQLGWVLDTIVSLWLLSIVLPIVGFGAFLWWAKRDIVQSACPNCGNEFQVFKSSLNDEEVQLCPFCSQPFSVEGNEFVKEPIKFSNRSSPFGQAFDDFSPWSGKDAVSAKLVARKSKGMPLLSISLSKLDHAATTEAMANMSLDLFKAYNVLKDHSGTDVSAIYEIKQGLEEYLPVLLGLTIKECGAIEAVQFKWITIDGKQEICVSNSWFEVLSVVYMLAVLTLVEANIIREGRKVEEEEM